MNLLFLNKLFSERNILSNVHEISGCVNKSVTRNYYQRRNPAMMLNIEVVNTIAKSECMRRNLWPIADK